MRKKLDRNDKKAAEVRAFFVNEIDRTAIPSSLAPDELDNIIKRGNNLNQDRKIKVRKERKQRRPMQLRVLAAVMSLLLVVGIGVGTADRVQTSDLEYTAVKKTMTEETMEFSSIGLKSVAQSEGVAADDYTPIIRYLEDLRKQVEKENKDGFSFLNLVEETFNTTKDAAAPEAMEESIESSTKEYSDTNHQVENVQEGDIIKSDGRFLYVLSASGKLICDQVMPDGSLRQTASVGLIERFSAHPHLQEMFLYQNHIAVIAQHYEENGSRITVLLYTVDENGGLTESGSYAQQGYFVSARLTDGTLYVISAQRDFSVYRHYDDAKTVVPTVWNGEEQRLVTTEEIYITGCPDTVMGYTNVSGYRMGEDVSSMQITSMLGSGAAQVYCTEDTLYLFANNSYYRMVVGNNDGYTPQTTVNSFALRDGKAYALAQGVVIGRMLNQFSADEYNGCLRVATTDENACRITVLDASLQKVSELTGLAEGEDIYACKFMGDTAYLVTFYQTDPLFVLDLSDVMNMKVTGELKIPGYSSYLYPIGENYLIGVGRNADENGVVDGMRVNLFDVSDPYAPKLADVKILYGDCASLAGETHKAYYADDKNGLVGFPVYRYTGGREQFNGFVLFSVENGNLMIAKELDRAEEMTELDWNTEQKNHYAYNGYHIQRGVYVGEYLYLLSDRAIYVYGRTDFAYLGHFDLD